MVLTVLCFLLDALHQKWRRRKKPKAHVWLNRRGTVTVNLLSMSAVVNLDMH